MTRPQIQARFLLPLTGPSPPRSVSGTVEALLGFTADDFLSGRVRLRDRFHREDAAIADLLFSPLFEGDSSPLAFRLRGADGRIRCLRAQARKTSDSSGALVLDLLLEDVRGLCEPGDAGLAASFKTLIEQTRDIVYVKDRNHVILAVSRALVDLAESAQGPADLIGKTDYDLFPEALADISYRNERRTFAEGRRVSEIVQTSNRFGRRIWLDDRKYPLNNAEGSIVGLFGIAPDITEYVEAQQALQEREAALREAQQIAGLGSFVLDIPSRTWTVSPAVREFFGLEAGTDLDFDRLWPLIHPDDRAIAVERLRALLSGKVQTFEREYRVLRPTDGAVLWVETRGRIETDGEGHPVRLRGTVLDITAKKQADASLRQSRELLQLFIEHAPVPLAMFDREMRYLSVSRRWLESYAFLGHDIIGKCSYDLFPNMPEHWKEEHRRALAGESVQMEDDRFVATDGREHWIRRELRPWFTAEGEIGGIVLLTEDITQRKLAESALRESKDLLQLFIEHAPAGLAMLDREMRYLAVSRRWIEMHHLDGEDIVGRNHYDLFPALSDQWKEEHRRALAGEAIPVNEGLFAGSDGKAHWARREVRPWRTGDGEIGGIVIFSEDITQQKQAEERMRLAATVFTNAAEGIAITDADANILEVNEAFTRITGYRREEVLGKNPRILQSGVQTPEFYENMWQSLLKSGQWSGEIWNRTKEGEIFAEELKIDAIRDAQGNAVQYVALFSDVTQTKEQQRQLEHVAHYDALTGLPNRSLLVDRLRQGMAQAHRRNQFLALAYLDLDGFKAINEKYGQDAGDNLLTAVARRMKLALREGDSLARLGGDEFAVVILDLPNPEAANQALARLLSATGQSMRMGTRHLRVTASIGAAIYPAPDDPDADQLLRQAGQAMYQAKVAGRNRVVLFDSSQDKTLQVRSQELERILRALTQREFVLYFQPKVNMRTGMVVGAEALIRWRHPERGLLAPGQFLPIIDNHPLSIELGEWVIDTALAQMETWLDAGLDLPISVNVGALQLQQQDFAERLRLLLAAHPPIRPGKLELEVLETSALQDLVQTSSVLEACRTLGVSVAIDDFGTGYASLTYLKRLPVQTLKIDQSFVRDILEDPDSLSILEAVLGLATAFRRDLVAEGVETVEHGLMLLQLGCEVAQGYGIARPMPAEDLPGWIQRWRADPRWFGAPAVHAGNRLLLSACVEHRAWLGAFESYLQGKRHDPPPLDPRACRFSAWLDAEREAGRGNLTAFRAIELLHEQLHATTAEILNSQAAGPNSEGLARLSLLHRMHDEFLGNLMNLN
ncbi:MAG: PAS domain S-box protein [Acidobacteriota bacterium]